MKPTISNSEQRTFNIRSSVSGNDGEHKISGVIPYNSDSVDMYGVTERIKPTAFSKTIADGADVKCFVSHDSSRILGSTRAGTMRLESREDGLHFEVDAPDTTDGHDALEMIRRGDCDTLSFGFVPVKTEWDESDPDHPVRNLVEVRLLEVSVCVAFPAYPAGKVSARDALGLINEKIDFISGHKDQLTDDDMATLREVSGTLDALLRTAAGTEPQESTQPQSTGETDNGQEPKEDGNARARFSFYARNK